jgi:hypothetical protein
MKTRLLSFFASLLFRLLKLTYSYKLEFHSEDQTKLLQSKSPNNDLKYLIAFFHQDELALIPYFIDSKHAALVSLSKDGEIMSRAIANLGLTPIRGSSSRGAVSGLIAAIRKVKEGYTLAFAVDGPRGPIYKVKDGLSKVSEKTQTKILPIRASVNSEYIFEKAWNKAKLAKPFATITIKVGKLDYYTPQELEQTLLNLN